MPSSLGLKGNGERECEIIEIGIPRGIAWGRVSDEHAYGQIEMICKALIDDASGLSTLLLFVLGQGV